MHFKVFNWDLGVGNTVSGLQWFAHSIMLNKTLCIITQIRWKISKTKRQVHGKEVDFAHIYLVVGCSLCFIAALPTISHNTPKMKAWQYWKYFPGNQIILKIRCKCIEGGTCKMTGILSSLIIIVISRNAMNYFFLLCLSSTFA